jgi:hypothetical protein
VGVANGGLEGTVTYVVFMNDIVAVELRWIRNVLRWPRRVESRETYHVQTIPWRIASNDIDFLVLVQPHDVFESNLIE